MIAQVVYDTLHGKSEKVASKFNFEVSNCKNAILFADVVIFICPTYGDEELPHMMEDYLLSINSNPRYFVVCELGNYYGYDDFTFGAKKIIESYLINIGWKKFFKGLSLDSIPTIDWQIFFKWKEELEYALQNNIE